MAGMTPWLAASIALLPPLGLSIVYALRGRLMQRLVAVQLTSSVGLLLIVTLSFALRASVSIDLALTLALLTLPSTLLFALFLERWL